MSTSTRPSAAPSRARAQEHDAPEAPEAEQKTAKQAINWREVEYDTKPSPKRGVPMTTIRSGSKTVGVVMRVDFNANKEGSEPDIAYKVTGSIVYNRELGALIESAGGRTRNEPAFDRQGEPLVGEDGKRITSLAAIIPESCVSGVIESMSKYKGNDGRAGCLAEALRRTKNWNGA